MSGVAVSWLWSATTGESVIGALHHIIPNQIIGDDDDGTFFGIGNSGLGRALDRNNVATGLTMMAGIAAWYKWG